MTDHTEFSGHVISVAPYTGWVSTFCDASAAGRWMTEDLEEMKELLEIECPEGCRND